MGKDAIDDPYQAQRRPFELPCKDCGEVGPVVGLRRPENGTIDTPLEPLCADCTGITRRVWGPARLPEYAQPPEGGTYTIPETGEKLHVVICPRCGGTGLVFGGSCFECGGNRWTFLSERSVRRTARWWQTFQQNRVPDA